ncbi:MAG: chemotaxis protein CheB, partial [Devosia sp.]
MADTSTTARLPVGTARTPALSLVAIGASAGGLDACTRLVGAMPTGHGIAMILVQHLDPHHDSLMVSLLANRTEYVTAQASEAAEILADHLYIIPPGQYLTVEDGHLHLEPPPEQHGARLPFDMLLESLAKNRGHGVFGIVLSGTGTDGSMGLQALRKAGGYCIAQDPKEAGYDAMPANAIATGAIDQIASAAAIPAIVLDHLGKHKKRGPKLATLVTPDVDTLAEILSTIKQASGQDFGAYKPGTVGRRVERRMALAGILPGSMPRYLKLVQTDPAEQESLTSDLLINVTSFFRDPKVFDYLAEKVLPDLVAQ